MSDCQSDMLPFWFFILQDGDLQHLLLLSALSRDFITHPKLRQKEPEPTEVLSAPPFVAFTRCCSATGRAAVGEKACGAAQRVAAELRAEHVEGVIIRILYG